MPTRLPAARPSPRIYNLFPLLVGSVRDWENQLPHIERMNFNWIFVNPFHETGSSGSLYAIKDFYRLNPLFQGKSRGPAENLLADFLVRAEERGLSVMMDLVINHTARDSALVEQYPEWFAREPDGSIRSPFAVDPNDPNHRTVWTDLAEIDFDNPAHRAEMVAYWKDLVRYYVRLGFHGFRCDAAYKVPGEVWREVIEAARQARPETMFFAETLGSPLEQIEQLHGAGFDYLFNSAKWWDFHSGWLLDQYERFRHIAPSVAFPESHDTARLAAETGGDERQSKLRYLFSAYFSAAVMMPVGYEFGLRRQLHVVMTRPTPIEAPSFDITTFVAAANAMKAACPVLNDEGPQARFTPPAAPLVGLVRRSDKAPGCVAALINTHGEHAHDMSASHVAEILEASPQNMNEITPMIVHPFSPSDQRIRVAPLEMRIFYAEGNKPA